MVTVHTTEESSSDMQGNINWQDKAGMSKVAGGGISLSTVHCCASDNDSFSDITNAMSEQSISSQESNSFRLSSGSQKGT